MITKQCSTCKKEKCVEDFHKSSKAPSGYEYSCKECWKVYRRNHYLQNKEKYLLKARKWEEVQKTKYRKLKSELCCLVCNENEISCLDFHHKDPSKKEYSVSSKANRVGVEKLKKEIDKCVVLCANCHRKVHAGVIKI